MIVFLSIILGSILHMSLIQEGQSPARKIVNSSSNTYEGSELSSLMKTLTLRARQVVLFTQSQPCVA